jgi:hypothetical protein
MTLGSMPTLNSVGFFAMRRSRQMVKQASRNTGVACEAELRARILTRSEGDVLKVNGTPLHFLPARPTETARLSHAHGGSRLLPAGSAF